MVGDPLDYITDLTVPDRSTWAMAQETCDRYGLWERLPAAVAERLRRADPASETPKVLPAVRTWVVADAGQMCAAAAEEARRRGFAPRLLGLDWEGEAREAGSALARLILDAAAAHLPAGRRREHGDAGGAAESAGARTGGGPNQEAALAAALALEGAAARPPSSAWTPTAPTAPPTRPAASSTILRCRRRGRPARTFRPPSPPTRPTTPSATSATWSLTGPTGTNVNDLKVAVRL